MNANDINAQNRVFGVRLALAGFGTSALLVAGITALVGNPAHAAPAASTASGISVSGSEHLDAQPSVSSSGAVTQSGGSVATKSGAVAASGITIKAGAGIAEASVASVRIGGTTVGPFSAECNQGVTTVHASATSKGNLKVTPGTAGGSSATAATITVTAAGSGKNGPNETITVTVASVSCGTGTPTPTPPTSTHPGTPGTPTVPQPAPTRQLARPGDHTQHYDDNGDQPAPAPTAKPGHLPVTG